MVNKTFLNLLLNLTGHVLVGIWAYRNLGLLERYAMKNKVEETSVRSTVNEAAKGFVDAILPPIRRYAYYSSSTIDWGYWHRYLMNLSYMFLISEGFLMFSEHNYTNCLSDRTKRLIHLVLFVTATVLATLGVIVTFVDGTGSAYSLHEIMGFLSYGILVASALFGGGGRLCSVFRSGKFQRSHDILGIIAYIVGAIALSYMYRGLWNIMLVVIALCTCCTVPAFFAAKRHGSSILPG